MRGPQIGHFRRTDSLDNFLQEFTIIQGHIKPDNVLTALELDAYANLTEQVLSHGKFLQTDFQELFPDDPFPSDIIIAGDFNADGSYLSNSKQANLIFSTDENYYWLVEDNTDTTVAASSNTVCVKLK